MRNRCMPLLRTLQFPNGPQRTLEDLKDRYYAIARRLLVAREGTDATLLNNQLLRQPYNANAERARRAALNTLMTRTNEAEASENEVGAVCACVCGL
jgi:DNA methyltransferase 1-associated protein 1